MTEQQAAPIFWDSPYVLTSRGQSFLKTLNTDSASANALILPLFKNPARPSDIHGEVGSSREAFSKYLGKMIDEGIIAEEITVPKFDRPVFILCLCRSGSTLLLTTLSQSPDVWSIGHEANDLYRGIDPLIPQNRNYESERATEADARPEITEHIKRWYAESFFNRDGKKYVHLEPSKRPPSVRLLDKTPTCALKIPFLRASFPDAKFIFLYRDPRENIASLIEAWISNDYIFYLNVPGWDRQHYSFCLVPGWRDTNGKSVAEIAAHQWKTTNQLILDDLEKLPPSCWTSVNYSQIVERPDIHVERLLKFAGLQIDDKVRNLAKESLPVSRSAVTAPKKDKWKAHESEIESVMPSLTGVWQRLQRLV